MLKNYPLLGLTALLLHLAACQNRDEIVTPIHQSNTQLWQHSTVENKYIVVLKPETVVNFSKQFKTNEAPELIVAKFAEQLTHENHMDLSNSKFFAHLIEGFTITASAEQMATLKENDAIKSIEPDRLVMLSNGKGRNNQEADATTQSEQPAQTTPYNIHRVGTTKSSGEGRVWVIDTGIDFNHPDLNINTRLSKAFLSNTKGNASASDEHGHGTHVSGIIGAIDNSIGTVGVASGCELVSVRVLNGGGYGLLSDVILAVDYVSKRGNSGDVVNMSIGMPPSDALDDAIKAAATNGFLFAVAAGNSSTNASALSPARLNAPGVYTISAMDNNDYWASFSNYGSSVNYCEPGVNVYSTWLNGGYATLSGTSMAAPHMAGILHITKGKPVSSGVVINDPDNSPDPIGHL